MNITIKRRWTNQEDSFIKENFSILSYLQIAEKLNRTRKSIAHRTIVLGLSIPISNWSKEEDDYLKNNYQNKTIKEMQLEFLTKRSEDSINQRANKTFNLFKIHWTPEQLELLRNKSEIESCESFGKKIGKSECATYQMIAKLGLRTRANEVGKYTINDDFFNEINPLSSFYAGWLAADGCVYTNKNKNLVQLSLQSGDVDIIEKFIKDINYGGKPQFFRNDYGFGKPGIQKVSISIYSKKWVEDLNKNFNIGPRKSLTLLPPNIYDILNKLCYICGATEGDGCFGLHNISETNKNIHPYINISGTQELLNWIKLFYDKFYGEQALYNNKVLAKPNHIKKCIDKNVYQYTVSGLRAAKILRDMYNLPIPKLARKWNKEFLIKLSEYINARPEYYKEKFDIPLDIPPSQSYNNQNNQPEQINGTQT